jgi:hypothetical protein
MQRLRFRHINGTAQQILQLLTQADQPEQGLVIGEVDQ